MRDERLFIKMSELVLKPSFPTMDFMLIPLCQSVLKENCSYQDTGFQGTSWENLKIWSEDYPLRVGV